MFHVKQLAECGTPGRNSPAQVPTGRTPARDHASVPIRWSASPRDICSHRRAAPPAPEGSNDIRSGVRPVVVCNRRSFIEVPHPRNRRHRLRWPGNTIHADMSPRAPPHVNDRRGRSRRVSHTDPASDVRARTRNVVAAHGVEGPTMPRNLAGWNHSRREHREGPRLRGGYPFCERVGIPEPGISEPHSHDRGGSTGKQNLEPRHGRPGWSQRAHPHPALRHARR